MFKGSTSEMEMYPSNRVFERLNVKLLKCIIIQTGLETMIVIKIFKFSVFTTFFPVACAIDWFRC